jgi:hypothetical protein
MFPRLPPTNNHPKPKKPMKSLNWDKISDVRKILIDIFVTYKYL